MAAQKKKETTPQSDALAILHSWIRDDATMQRLLAEERSNAAIARQIYMLRTRRGLTQKQLAELIGTKQPVIARLEDADYRGHSLAMLYRIGAALGCSVSVEFVPRRAVRRQRAAPRLRRA